MTLPTMGRIVLYKTRSAQTRGQSIGAPAIINEVLGDTYLSLTVFTKHGTFVTDANQCKDPTVGYADDLAEGEWCWPSKEPARRHVRTGEVQDKKDPGASGVAAQSGSGEGDAGGEGSSAQDPAAEQA